MLALRSTPTAASWLGPIFPATQQRNPAWRFAGATGALRPWRPTIIVRTMFVIFSIDFLLESALRLAMLMLTVVSRPGIVTGMINCSSLTMCRTNPTSPGTSAFSRIGLSASMSGRPESICKFSGSGKPDTMRVVEVSEAILGRKVWTRKNTLMAKTSTNGLMKSPRNM